MTTAASRTRLEVEALEVREVLSGFTPTAYEQLFLERLNDARANPAAYGASIGLNLSNVAPSQPLAFDTRLIQTARLHSVEMAVYNYFGHNDIYGQDPGQRMLAAGYPWSSWAESIAAGYSSPEQALASLIIDSGVADLGHRRHLLAIDSYFKVQQQIGIGVVLGGGGTYGNYYTLDSGQTADTRPFLTGVLFNDANHNGRYDLNEGRPGLRVEVWSGNTLAGAVNAFDTGGYGLQLNPGIYQVRVLSGSTLLAASGVALGAQNVRFNLDLSAAGQNHPAPPPPPVWTTLSGDFDGDGKTDVARKDPATGNWRVVLASGNAPSGTVWARWGGVSGLWSDLQVGDFNGDGKADLVGRYSNGSVWVSLSSGKGFTTTQWDTWYAAPGFAWADVRVGDFNGDGKDDLAARVPFDGRVYVAVSNGTGFEQQPWAPWAAIVWQDVQVGDFNRDGKADLVGRTPDGQVYVALANWSGTGFDAQTLWDTWAGIAWQDVRVGDFNGDGKLDLVGRVSDGRVYVAVSDGMSFRQQLWTQWAGISWSDVLVGDFNGDGRSDLVARVPFNGGVYMALSNGTGFDSQPLWATWYAAAGFDWGDVRVGDFNGDGRLDLVARTPAGGVFVALQNSTPGFAAQKLWISA